MSQFTPSYQALRCRRWHQHVVIALAGVVVVASSHVSLPLREILVIDESLPRSARLLRREKSFEEHKRYHTSESVIDDVLEPLPVMESFSENGLGSHHRLRSHRVTHSSGYHSSKVFASVGEESSPRRIPGKSKGRQVPHVIRLHVRTSSAMRPAVSGRYILVRGRRVRGFPLWKQSGGTHWIFSDRNGHWSVGGPNEEKDRFDCEGGLLTMPFPHRGRMPNELGHAHWRISMRHSHVETSHGFPVVDEIREPKTDPCGWTEWSIWSSCSVTCSSSVGNTPRRSRSRIAANKSTMGLSDELTLCGDQNGVEFSSCGSLQRCSVDCEFGDWGPWTSECSKSCGGGVQRRLRPKVIAESYGGVCVPPSFDQRPCNSFPCSIPPSECELSEWSGWSVCPVTCGGGIQHSIRSFLSGQVLDRGDREAREYCGESARARTQVCNTQPCTRFKSCDVEPCAEDAFSLELVAGSGAKAHQRAREPEMAALENRVMRHEGDASEIMASLGSQPYRYVQVKCQGHQVGDRFLEVGDFRLGDVDGTHFSIAHRLGKTAAVFRKDGVAFRGPLESFSTFHRKVEKASGIDYGDRFILIGEWRLGIEDLAMFSIRHSSGTFGALFADDGSAVRIVQSNASLDLKSLGKPVQVMFGDRYINIGDWRLEDTIGENFTLSHRRGLAAYQWRKDGTSVPGPLRVGVDIQSIGYQGTDACLQSPWIALKNTTRKGAARISDDTASWTKDNAFCNDIVRTLEPVVTFAAYPNDSADVAGLQIGFCTASTVDKPNETENNARGLMGLSKGAWIYDCATGLYRGPESTSPETCGRPCLPGSTVFAEVIGQALKFYLNGSLQCTKTSVVPEKMYACASACHVNLSLKIVGLEVPALATATPITCRDVGMEKVERSNVIGFNIAARNARGGGGVTFGSGSYQGPGSGSCSKSDAGIGNMFASGKRCFTNINDGVFSRSSSWSPDLSSGLMFVGIQFGGLRLVRGIRVSCTDGTPSLLEGNHILQYTQEPKADYATERRKWCTVGNFTRNANDVYYKFQTPIPATAIRTIVTNRWACIDEIEVYEEYEASVPRLELMSSMIAAEQVGDLVLDPLSGAEFGTLVTNVYDTVSNWNFAKSGTQYRNLSRASNAFQFKSTYTQCFWLWLWDTSFDAVPATYRTLYSTERGYTISFKPANGTGTGRELGMFDEQGIFNALFPTTNFPPGEGWSFLCAVGEPNNATVTLPRGSTAFYLTADFKNLTFIGRVNRSVPAGDRIATLGTPGQGAGRIAAFFHWNRKLGLGDLGDVLRKSNFPKSPSDCQWSEWQEWSTPCTATCGAGRTQRNRVVKKEAANGGVACNLSNAIETAVCSYSYCPMDCVWSSWNAWSECSRSCGRGFRRRERFISQEGAYGGARCTAKAQEVGACQGNLPNCGNDCKYSDWTDWSACFGACNKQIMARNRTISSIAVLPGKACDQKELTATVKCPQQLSCDVDCRWGQWGDWGGCSSEGYASRVRTVRVERQGDGHSCPGGSSIIRTCSTSMSLPVGHTVCEFSAWTAWTMCPTSCGGQSKSSRARKLKGNASLCQGSLAEERPCGAHPCPRDCLWDEWGLWGECSQSCGRGMKSRHRGYLVLAAAGGMDCDGQKVEVVDCNVGICMQDCFWQPWGEWGECTATCGNGFSQRIRHDVPAAYGGRLCEGEPREVTTCVSATAECPIDCRWGHWGEWSTCSHSCGNGVLTRTRAKELEESHGGLPCTALGTEHLQCNDFPCPIDGWWGEWSDWSLCNAKCRIERVRVKYPAMYGGKAAKGSSGQFYKCYTGKGCSGKPTPSPTPESAVAN